MLEQIMEDFGVKRPKELPKYLFRDDADREVQIWFHRFEVAGKGTIMRYLKINFDPVRHPIRKWLVKSGFYVQYRIAYSVLNRLVYD